MAETILIEKQEKFVPEFRAFRDYVNEHCQYWNKQEEIAIKLLYLLGSRASEIITKVSPRQAELQMTRAYGKVLRYEFVNYQPKNGEQFKILLVHAAIAKSTKNQHPEMFQQGGIREPERIVVPMREIPIIVQPTTIEPWATDILFWIRDKSKEAARNGEDQEKAAKEALRFHVTEQTLQNWVWNNLKGLTPANYEPEIFSRFSRIRKPIHPHSLRTWRITHLKNAYKFTPLEQCAFVRWSVRSQEAKRGITVSSNVDIYSHLSWRDFVDKLCVPLSEVL